MSIFKSFRMTWWQGGLWKISLISLGIIIGTSLPQIFTRWGDIVWFLVIVPGFYVIYVWAKQK